MRKDKKPLTLEALETMVAFNIKILDAAGYPEHHGWAPPAELMNPATFQMFSRDYYAEQRKKERPGFDEFFAPL